MLQCINLRKGDIHIHSMVMLVPLPFKSQLNITTSGCLPAFMEKLNCYVFWGFSACGFKYGMDCIDIIYFCSGVCLPERTESISDCLTYPCNLYAYHRLCHLVRSQHMLVEWINMSTVWICYVGYIIYMFKDMFTVRDREDKIRMNSDMTISEDALVRILKTIRKLKDFFALFQLPFAKGKFVPRHLLKLRLYSLLPLE